MYQQEWQQAIDASNQALSINSQLQNLNADTSILPSEYNSVESILALEKVASFDLVTYSNIATNLIAAYQTEEDLRLQLYYNQSTDGNYRSVKSAETKFKVSFRTAELYLINAEALAHLGQDNLAKQTLIEFAENRYTTDGWKAYTTKVNGLSSDDLLTEILEERRRELAIEGHRWSDLRRTTQPALSKTYNSVSYQLKENDERYVIPFPNDAVINNPNL